VGEKYLRSGAVTKVVGWAEFEWRNLNLGKKLGGLRLVCDCEVLFNSECAEETQRLGSLEFGLTAKD
jgi:hypothetical protein